LPVEAQVKHLVYFTDKGIAPGTIFPNTELIEEITSTLSKRTLERRSALSCETAVSIRDLPVCCQYINALKALGVTVVECLKWPNAVSCYIPPDVIPQVRFLPFVRSVETIGRLYPAIHNPPASSSGTFHPIAKGSANHRYNYGPSYDQAVFVDIPNVHDEGYAGEGVVIGIIDTGFKDTHPALKHLRLLAERDFINDDDETSNEGDEDARQHLHGTMTLGSLAGFSEGTLVGYAPDASYLLAKTEHVAVDQHVEEDRVAAAVEWLEAMGADIIVVPFGWTSFDDGSGYDQSNNDGEHSIASRALAAAYERGVTIITAAGDSPETGIAPPGDAKHAVCVGGITPSGLPSDYSSRGPTADGRLKPDVMGFAEGYGVAAYADDDGYSMGEGSYGTDVAATQAAGIAALLLSAHPHLRNDQVSDILKKTSGKADSPDNLCGYGKLSATCALNFPNLSRDLSKYFVHKLFVGKDVMSGSVRLHMSLNGSDYWNEQMASTGNGYIYGIPYCMTGDQLRFYVSYTTNEGMRVREPSDDAKVFSLEYGSWEIACASKVTGIDRLDGIPAQCSLSQNYPNPFSSGTTITFAIPERGLVHVDVTDVTGRTVATLVEGVRDAGSYQLVVDVSRLGRDLPSGVYLCRMRALNEMHTVRMLLSR
jgi:subtilisin family serine protease